MAIKKTIIERNGVNTEYHRIAMIKIDTNQQNTILVHSYLSSDGRQIEKDYAAGLYSDMDSGSVHFPYVEGKYLNCNYDGEMTISKAYEWLKEQPGYEGAEDI